MRTVFSALLAIAFAFACGGEEPSAIGPDSFEHYIAAQEGLAADDFEKAKEALLRLSDSCRGEIRDLSRQAAAGPDISAVRGAFKPLSTAMLEMKRPPGTAVVYCPMADGFQGARWIQKEGPIRNPYFGAEMLDCGTFEN